MIALAFFCFLVFLRMRRFLFLVFGAFFVNVSFASSDFVGFDDDSRRVMCTMEYAPDVFYEEDGSRFYCGGYMVPNSPSTVDLRCEDVVNCVDSERFLCPRNE